MSRMVLKLLNQVYGWIIGIVLTAAVAYAGYSIWDNFQIYQAAEDVQDQIRKLKPDDNTKNGPGFDELRALNGEVVGWITVDGTNIDYPVLQGDTNLVYMNRDVYGNFSLAGSIFLDIRNQADFSDNYSLIYGHNMDEHLMFGDLALFKDKTFFQKNTTASLMLPGETREFQVAAVLQLSAGTDEIFNPDHWKDSLSGLGEFLEANSIWYHTKLLEQLKAKPEQMEAVSLVTCSDGSTNDRTVLILIRQKPSNGNTPEKEPSSPENSDSKEPSSTPAPNSSIGGNGPKQTGDSQNPDFWKAVIAGIVLFIAAFEIIDRCRSRQKKR